MFIIQAIVFGVILCLLSLVVYLPYYLVREIIRLMLYAIGIDLYTEEEKVNAELSKENRILSLQREIQIEDEMQIPISTKIDNLHEDVFGSSKKRKKYLSAPEKSRMISYDENIVISSSSSKNKNKVISLDKEPKETILENKNKEEEILDLNQISNLLEKISNKY